MKTLVLATVSAVALLAAGAASAQSTSGVESGIASMKAGLQTLTGTDGSRPGQPFDTRSYVDQVGNNNTANTDQTINYTQGGPTPTNVDNNYGQPLNSTILQGWGGGRSDGSTANVTQSGLNNLSVVMQRNYPTANYGNNSASVNQSGTRQNGFTYQYGRDNQSSLAQSGTDTAAPGSSVSTRDNANNGGTFAGSFHGADQANSHMNDNGARIIQDEAMGDKANTNITGNDDKATTVQWYAERDTANISQGGSNNSAVSYQTGRDSSVGINQSNTGNKASVFQVTGDQDGSAYGVPGADDGYNDTANVSQSGMNGTATVLQGGNNNTAGITQNNAYGAPFKGVLANTAAIRQVGTYQTAYITQQGGDDHALTTQQGTNNSASTTQNTEGAYALTTQSGSGNVANVTQTYGGPTNGFFMVSRVDQSGTNSTANVYQTGRDAYSDVAQIGTGSNRNTANITQTSFNPVSFAYQNGSGNMINTYQH